MRISTYIDYKSPCPLLRNSNFGSRFVIIILAMFSSFAFVMDKDISDNASGNDMLGAFIKVFEFSVDGYGILWLALLLLLIYFYLNVFNSRNNFICASVLIPSILFSLIMIFGYSFQTVGSWYLVFGTNVQSIKSLVLLIGYTALFSACISQGYRFLNFQKTKSHPEKCNRITETLFVKKSFINVWLLILVAWLPYLVLCFPGNVWWDSVVQIKQFFGIEAINTMSPFFQTLLVGGSMWLGKLVGSDDMGVFIYCFVQMVFSAAVLSYSIFYMGKMKTPYWFRYAVLILYSLLPIFPTYALSMGKDTNLSLVIILFVIYIIELIRNPQNIMNYNLRLVGLGVVLLLICLLRNAGFYLVIVSIPVLIYAARKYLLKICTVLASVILIFVLYSNVFLPLMNVEKGSIREIFSIPFQQTARFAKYYSYEVTSEEREIINRVLDYENLSTNYDPEISDPVKQTFNENATSKDIMAYFGVWFNQFLRHPGTYIQATVNNSYGYFYPDNICRSKPLAIWGTKDAIYYLDDFNFSQSASPQEVERFTYIIRNIPGIGMLLGIGIYTWIYILAFSIICRAKKYKLLLALTPSLFVLLGCISSPVNAYFRYSLSFIFSIPMVVAICLYATGITIRESDQTSDSHVGKATTIKNDHV